MTLEVRPYRGERDEATAVALLERALCDRVQARRGELIDVLALPGFVAERDGASVGLLTYRQEVDACELAALVARDPGEGIATALVERLRSSVPASCPRIWVVTTNDNLDALRFYQRRGFVLRTVRPGAVADARRSLKPTIALTGAYGIPLRDELELELLLRT